MNVEESIKNLEQSIALMKEYLQLRFAMDDMHGVRDAAADIECLQGQLRVYKSMRNKCIGKTAQDAVAPPSSST